MRWILALLALPLVGCVLFFDDDFVPTGGVGGPGTCTPDCVGRECGGDGCGSTCGQCAGSLQCSNAGVCQSTTAPDTGCSRILQCVNTCVDESCFTGCVNAGDEPAQADFLGVIECIRFECADVDPSDDVAFNDCQQRFCATEIAICLGHDPVDRGDSCEEVVACVLPCNTEACAVACVDRGSVSSQNAARALLECGVENCFDAVTIEQWVVCAQDWCPDQYAQCVATR